MLKNPVALGQTENMQNVSSDHNTDPFKIKSFARNKVEFSVPTSDVYTLSIQTVQGRIITQKSRFFNARNSHRISFNESLARGAYVVRISNGKESAVKKSVFIQ